MADIKIGQMILGPVQTNCYILHQEHTKEAVVIDPAYDGKKIWDTLQKNGLKLTAILLTHGHFDHIMGANELRELSGVKVYAYEEERSVCEDEQVNCSCDFGKAHTVKADVYVKDGEKLNMLDTVITVLATPGHTMGSTCYYLEREEILLSGDTLFQESVGRTDFPTGSMSSLVHSIKEKLYPLPDTVTVYPGHGESTTIAYEKQYNPYCR